MRTNRTSSRRGRGGFTLLELLTVVAIMGMLMLIAVVGFKDLNRGSAMKGSVLNFRSSLSHARQHAITKRVRTQLVYGNSNWMNRLTGFYYLSTNDDSGAAFTIGPISYTVDGILFSNTLSAGVVFSDTNIVFDFDGSCLGSSAWGGTGTLTMPIMLYEALINGSPRPNGLTTTNTLYKLTGRVKGTGWVIE